MAGAFNGKAVVLTGKLAKMKRGEAKKRIQQQGGRIGTSVTSKTDYLVVGEKPGSKLVAAQKAGIQILDEEAFLDLLEERP